MLDDAAPHKTLFNSRNIDFFYYSYFAKIMTRKSKIGNLTNMTELYPFLVSTKWHLLIKGILSGDVTSYENQEFDEQVMQTNT